VTTSRAKSVES